MSETVPRNFSSENELEQPIKSVAKKGLSGGDDSQSLKEKNSPSGPHSRESVHRAFFQEPVLPLYSLTQWKEISERRKEAKRPKNLLDFFDRIYSDKFQGTGNRAHLMRHREKNLDRFKSIDFQTLEYLYLSDISRGDESMAYEEALGDLLWRAESDPKKVVRNIKKIVRNYDLLDDDVIEDFFNQELFREEVHLDYVANAKNDQEIAERVAKLYPHDYDSDTFLFSVIENIDRIAKKYPEAKDEAENAYLELYKYLRKKIKSGFGGEYYTDEELGTEEDYQDLSLEDGRAYDNVFSFRLMQILQRLNETGTRKSIDYLLKIFPKDSAYYIPAIGRTLSQIDSPYVAEKLLPLLKNKDSFTRKGASKMLYLVELGKIGISEKGVEYLGKLYNLGELNHSDYFVQRLTADGNMGIFDENKNLSGYFQLGDIAGSEKNIRAAVLDIALETLFGPNAEERPEKRAERAKILEEFKTKYYDFYFSDFLKNTGVRFNNLSFREQGWFLQFATHSSPERQKRIQSFVKNYQEIGLKTFLALDYSRELGEKILTIGENLPQIDAERIFAKYGEIADAANAIEAYVADAYKDSIQFTDAQIQLMKENLLKKGNDLLVYFADQVENGKFKKASEGDIVVKQLDTIKTELLLFSDAFRSLHESGTKLRFSDINGIDCRIELADQLKLKDIKAMRQIYADNYKDDLEMQRDLLAGFDKAVKKNDTRFYVVKRDGKIVAFDRFDFVKYYDKSGYSFYYYFASFNVAPDYRGNKFGEMLMEQSVDEEADMHEVRGDCPAYDDIGRSYIERGFVGTKFYDYKGKPSFSIEWDKRQNQKYQTKSWTKEQVCKLANDAEAKESPARGQYNIIIATENRPEDILFLQKIQEGYVLTRYFKEGGKYYAVFEPAREKESPAYIF